MNIVYNKDGSILITPTSDDEKIAIAYELQRKGTVALKHKLEEHYANRLQQRNYETGRDLTKELANLTEKDRGDIVELVRQEIDKRRKDGEVTRIRS
jgi:hypothetical protein